MKKCILKISFIISILYISFFLVSCHSVSENIQDSDKKAVSLEKNNWEPSVYAALNKLIIENGVSSKNYNPAKKPYAVFDWDNTSIINDIEESVLVYQLENLKFKVTPEKLNEIVRKDIPETDFSDEYKNNKGKKININLIADDIINDYKYLYNNYSGFKGNKSFDEIKETLQYKDFAIKMRFLYAAIGGTFSPDVSYPWVIYLFTGMKQEDVMQLTAEAIDYWLEHPVELKSFTSPEELPGKTGVVTTKLFLGIRTVKEMKNLMNALMSNGFDVYICSASFVDVIKTFSGNKCGYNVPKENVIAMELERDKNGIIIDEYRKGYDQTQNKGKTKNINRFLVSKYGYGPILVAGNDSKVKSKFDISILPGDSTHKGSGVIGGWGIGVNKYSKNPEIAAEVAKFLVSPECQKERALKIGSYPTSKAACIDPALTKAMPYYPIMREAVNKGLLRPAIQASPYYNQVSQIFYKTVYKVLAGDLMPDLAVKSIADKVHSLTELPITK